MTRQRIHRRLPGCRIFQWRRCPPGVRLLITEGAIGKLSIDGSIIGGSNGGIGGTNLNNGIVFATSIGSAAIKGDLLSESTFLGAMSSASAFSDSIDSLNIQGTVSGSYIQAGFNLAGVATTADAQIGKVTVGGNWIASSLAAGINPVNSFYGDANDVIIAAATIHPSPRASTPPS